MITESIAKALGYKVGYLLNEGYQVKCAGTQGTDANGMPVVSDRHLICTLDDHLPGAEAHAVGNSEFSDDLWSIEPNQTSINWSAPVCQVCGKELGQ